MRNYFSMVLIFLGMTTSVSAQCSINVTFHGYSKYANRKDQVPVLLLDENALSQKIEFKENLCTKIRGLEPGSYQIVYENKYGEFSRTLFELKKGQRKVPIDLKYDQLDSVKYLGKRNIDSLKPGDSLRVSFASRGCFHNFENTIIYYRDNDQLFATNLKDTVAVDSSALAKIRRFETELRYPLDGGCTTYDLYLVYLNGEAIAGAIDSSCNWSGYFRYLDSIFPKNDQE